MTDPVRAMPCDAEAERAVLGAMMVDSAVGVGVVDEVAADDFYLEAHKLIYSAMVERVAREEPCDMVVMTNALRERGTLAQCGGASYLAKMCDGFPDVAGAVHYARIVRDKARKRKLMAVCRAAALRCEADSGTAEEVIREAQEGVYELAETVGRSVPQQASTWSEANIALALELSQGKRETVGLSTGWPQVDALCGGLVPGEVTLVAARTTVGKTSFTIDMARRVAEHDKRVLYASLEMDGPSVNQKLLACIARVNSMAFREAGHRLEAVNSEGETKLDRLRWAQDKLAQMPLEVWEDPGLTPMQLRTRCRQLRMNGGLDLVIVDYVQRMTPDGQHREQHEGHVEISKALCTMAADLKLPLVGCAQVGRSGDKRDKSGRVVPPLLSEISGSTKYEQDAHNVVFLSRDVMDKEAVTEVILAKGRMGTTGTRRLKFWREHSRFDQIGSW